MAQPSSSSRTPSTGGPDQRTVVATKSTEDEAPPKVTSVVPAIFIPLDRDISEPFEGPRTRIERARKLLESIDSHQAGVSAGILHLAELERRRILREAEKWEAEHGVPDTIVGLPPAETEAMIRNMSAPAHPGQDYNVPTDELRPSFNAMVDLPIRADTVRQLQRVVEDGLNHLGGYELHMKAIRKKWTETLEKEERTMAAKFGPGPASASTEQTDRRDEDGDVVMRP